MKIKNWKKLQHFKERTPPWVKLYRDILEQRDINMISDCSFRVLIGLWLLAAEDKDLEGNLPKIPDIAFRLRKSEEQITKSLQELSAFLVYDDTAVISNRYQDDAPETETYSKEVEKEKERERGVSTKPPSPTPKNNRGTRLKEDWDIPDEWGEWSVENCGWAVDKVIETGRKFKDHWLSVAGSKGVKLDWFATWRNWCRRTNEGF